MRKKAIAEALGLDNEDMHVIAVSPRSVYKGYASQVCCLRQVMFLSSRVVGLVG